MSASVRLNFQRGLTEQPVAARWAVLYNASGKDASACVTDVASQGRRFMAESTSYVCFMATEDEAHYVSCYLNSGFANAAIKEFQAKGLFGERHVHKKILELPWPAFAPNNPWHRKLVALGRDAAKLALRAVGPQRDMELGTRDLGQLRLHVRREIATVLTEIDRLVKAISTGEDLRRMREDWQRLTDAPPTSSNTQDPAELSSALRAERDAWAHRELPKPSPTR